MNVLLRLLDWGWWVGVTLGVFLALLSSQWHGLELWAGVCGVFAFSCAFGGAALCLTGGSNG